MLDIACFVAWCVSAGEQEYEEHIKSLKDFEKQDTIARFFRKILAAGVRRD